MERPALRRELSTDQPEAGGLLVSLTGEAGDGSCRFSTFSTELSRLLQVRLVPVHSTGNYRGFPYLAGESWVVNVARTESNGRADPE